MPPTEVIFWDHPGRDTMKGHIIWKVAVACFFLSLPCSAWSPTEAFKEAFVPALDRFERAIITTNWKGFILRSDRQSQVNMQLPSESGLYLNGKGGAPGHPNHRLPAGGSQGGRRRLPGDLHLRP